MAAAVAVAAMAEVVLGKRTMWNIVGFVIPFD